MLRNLFKSLRKVAILFTVFSCGSLLVQYCCGSLGIVLTGVSMDKIWIAEEAQAIKDEGCNVPCDLSSPCVYPDLVDFRVIIIAYHDRRTLSACLEHVQNLQMFGDSMRVNIWITRQNNKTQIGKLKHEAEEFNLKSAVGMRVCVHEAPGGLLRQEFFINSWTPKDNNTKELGLIIRDDILLSPFAYLWLKRMRAQYSSVPDLAGFSLQTHDNYCQLGDSRATHYGLPADIAYMYPMASTYGWSPVSRHWPAFQAWYQENKDSLEPFVESLHMSSHYRMLLNLNITDWEFPWNMWHVYYSQPLGLYTAYSNLPVAFPNAPAHLAIRVADSKWWEPRRWAISRQNKRLIRAWNENITHLPLQMLRHEFDGSVGLQMELGSKLVDKDRLKMAKTHDESVCKTGDILKTINH